MKRSLCFAVQLLALWGLHSFTVTTLPADDGKLLLGKTFSCHDTLRIGDEKNTDAAECLKGFTWQPGPFTISLEASFKTDDYLVRFPSPITSENTVNDLVSLEWYIAKDLDEQPVNAPAVVVVHESARRMAVGRIFARSLCEMGCHTCLIHLPHYGARSDGKKPNDAAGFLMRVRQGVADTRRAYDAVKALPYVNGSVSIQGTSLGGFVAALAGSFDGCFDHVHLLLAGGDLNRMFLNGQRETAKVRQQLAEKGITGEALESLLYQIEPTRLAHRLDPSTTYLYSAQFDTVVPLANAKALSKAISLEQEHHILFPANHYSGIVFIPLVLKHIQDKAKLVKAK